MDEFHEKHAHFQENIGYDKEGGYVFILDPKKDSFTQNIITLYKSKFLNDQIFSIVIDFLTINILKKLKFTHTAIKFDIDSSENVLIKIENRGYNQIEFNTRNDEILIAFQLLISIMILTVIFFSIKEIFSKNSSYNKFNNNI